jgi:hypothetical protein
MLQVIRFSPATARMGAAAVGVALVAACAPTVDRQSAGTFRSAVVAGDYTAASQMASRLVSTPGGQPDLLWSLNTGATALHARAYPAAVQALDNAEARMRASEEASFSWGSTYRFGTYDAVMVNAYKALANLGSGDLDAARVELNRMEERQARTVARFQNEIAASMAERDRQVQSDVARAQALRNAEGSPEVGEQLRMLDTWRNYQPFVNPAGTYIRGIYLLNSRVAGDAEQARTAFERVAGIAGNPRIVVEDLAAARRAATGQRGAPQVWVIFENGQSPTFEQMNFTVPMPVLARGGGVTVRPVTVSMPRMVFQAPAYTSLEVTGGNARTTTALVGSIEGVMASEFRARYNGLLASAVFEAFAKAAGISAVNAVGSRMNGTAGLLMEIAATTAANVTVTDTRSWETLPREVQAARIPVPTDGQVMLRSPSGPQAMVTVPTGRSSIVLVKAQAPGSPLTVQVQPL